MSSWVNFPPTASGNIQTYDWFTQFTKSLDEAASAAANSIHPATTSLFDGNAIASLVTTSDSSVLTDVTKQWAINQSGYGWRKRYVNWDNPNILPDKQPGSYEVVLLNLFGDKWNWRKWLRLPINDQNMIDNGDGTSTSNQLILPPIDTVNHTLGYFTHYFIIRDRGAFPDIRVPEFPNDFTYEWARITASTTISVTVSRLERNWYDNQWAGKYLYYNEDNKTRWTVITRNERNADGDCVIYFNTVPVKPDLGIVGILGSANLYWKSGNQPQVAFNEGASIASCPTTAWVRFGSAQNDYYYTHLPNSDNYPARVGNMNFPNPAYTIIDSDSDDPHDLIIDVVNPDQGIYLWGNDLDVIIGDQTSLEPPDWCHTLPYHKTYRSWHQALWSACSAFIPYRGDFYNGSDQFHIDAMTIPRMMYEAGIYSAAGKTGSLVRDGDTVIGIEVDFTFSEPIEPDVLALGPVAGRMTIERSESWVQDGPDEVDSGWVDHGVETHDKGETMIRDASCTYQDGVLYVEGLDYPHQNQDVWFCLAGLKRHIPDRMRYMFYERECFVPDPIPTDPDSEFPPPDGPQIPPTEANGAIAAAPGTWVTRPKSSNLIDYDDHGQLTDPFAGAENGNAIPKANMLVRYVGDNFDDPTTTFSVSSEPRPWEVEYYDNFYEGKSDYPPQPSTNYDVTSGQVTVVDDKLQIGDDSQNFWSGVLISHTGTPTSIGATSLADTSKASSAFWDGSRGRWIGHWVTIKQPGDKTDGPCHNATRPITGYAPGSQTITFPTITGLSTTYTYLRQNGSTATGTTTYQIDEPAWEKNYWKGTRCEIRRQTDGAILHGTVTYSSNNHIRVDAWKDKTEVVVVYTPLVTDSFRLMRVATGTVWKYDGTKFIKPPVATYGDEQWKIPPTFRKLYGRLMPNDYVTARYFSDCKKMRGTLRMVKYPGLNFTARTDEQPCVDDDPKVADSNDNNFEWVVHACVTGDTILSSSYCGDTSNPVAFSINPSAFVDPQCSLQDVRSMGYCQLHIPAGITASFTSKRLRIAGVGRFLTYAQIDDTDPEDGFVDSDFEGTRYVFDANGDPVLFRHWNVFDSISSSTNIHHTSILFGSSALPDDADDVEAFPGIREQHKGYTVREAIAIMDYGPAMEFL